MLKQNILIGLGEVDNIPQYLHDTCDGVSQGSYMRQLTAEELSLKKELLSEKVIEHFKIKEEFDNIKEEYKNQLDPLAKETKHIAAVINAGYEECNGTTYKFIERETGYVGFYDERGNLVSSRRMLPDEHQGNIIAMTRAASAH